MPIRSLTAVHCPICGTPAGNGDQAGFSVLFLCPQCGGFWMAATLLESINNGSVSRPAPDHFRTILKRKRGESVSHPTITSFDLL